MHKLQPGGLAYCLSGNATAIMDARAVADWGWPNFVADQPGFLREYATLEELAEGEGIDVEGLLAEVERYNGFCEAGVDEDFARGCSAFDSDGNSVYDWAYSAMPGVRGDLPNWKLVPLGEAPFYAAKLGMGSIGTKGGLVIDAENRVLRNGEPIPGLYAAGCVADGPVGGYPGAGFPNAVSIVGCFAAAEHALGLGIL